jgi:hypothetical protein
MTRSNLTLRALERQPISDGLNPTWKQSRSFTTRFHAKIYGDMPLATSSRFTHTRGNPSQVRQLQQLPLQDGNAAQMQS